MKTGNIIVYTTKQVASIFHVEEDTVRGWVKDKTIPARKMGKQWFFEEKAVLELFGQAVSASEATAKGEEEK